MHTGHRERLRKRLSYEGSDSFEDHQLLEALLFFSIPRCDTNETAHRLIERFGSFADVFTAGRDELITVGGIGPASADLIRLVAGIERRIANSDINEHMCYDTVGKIGSYLTNMFVGVSVERVYLMMFDNSMRLLDCAHICDGTINSAVMLPRAMAERALFKHASAVVVAHNHPHGIAVPSGTDIETTETLRAAFELIGVQLLEHLVIAGRKYAPIMKLRNMAPRAEPGMPVVNSSFYSTFYSHFYDDLVPTP